jgi:hypothetical protein
MALEQVAQLARRAASDAHVLDALRTDPASVREPLNLSDAHLRALISAGSFTTARPVVTTSHTEALQSNAVAALEVGTLFPPDGQGQFPPPGDLPGAAAVVPHAPPAAPSRSSQPPNPTLGYGPNATPSPGAGIPSSGQAPGAGRTPLPGAGIPSSGQVPGAGRTPSVFQVPHGIPLAPAHTAPQAQGATPQTGTTAVTPRASGYSPIVSYPAGYQGNAVTLEGSATGSTGSYEPDNDTVTAVYDDQGFGVTAPELCTCECDVCEPAIVSIVAEVATSAQTAITSITAIAGLY